ncbi:MAG: adenosylmethionine--8-amino-7-oxononanoate transaminase [Rhodoglobus sp.]
MSLIERDRAVLWHPYSAPNSAAPLWEVMSAQGIRFKLRDESGGRHDVIDAMSSWWCAIHGYRNPVLDAAAHHQLGQFSHVMFGGLTHSPAVHLAEQLNGITPRGLDRVFFADSGSVSIEVALKLAVQYQASLGFSRRQRVLSIRGGYHGDTAGAMAVCDPINGMHSEFSGMLAQQIFAPRPPAAAHATDDDIVAWAQEVADIARRSSVQLAAIIVEPVLQGAGGMFIYPAECLQHLRAIADEHGLLLIVDEIATGFGRTGTFFAVEHAGVTPDIMCVGKALTGGYLSLAAMLCTAAVAKAITEGPVAALLHGPTFMANPLACAIATASLELLREMRWSESVARIETELAAGLAPAQKIAAVRDVRTIGAVGVIQLNSTVDVPAMTRAALRRGVWLRPFRDLVYTMPPYISETDDINSITAAMVGAVQEVSAS